MRSGLPSQVTEDPLHVAGNGQAARPPGGIPDLEHRPLHRRRRVHVHPQLRRDAVFHVLEHAVTEPVPARVRACASGRQGRRRPEAAALLVPKVERFTAGIGHRVVRPRAQPELVGVLSPAIRRPALRHDGAEPGVRDHVHPGRRRHRSRPHGDDVLVAVRRESPKPVEEHQVASGRQRLCGSRRAEHEGRREPRRERLRRPAAGLRRQRAAAIGDDTLATDRNRFRSSTEICSAGRTRFRPAGPGHASRGQPR